MPSAVAFLTPSKTIAELSPPSGPAMTGTPIRSAQILQLLDRRGPEGVAGGEQHAIILLEEQVGELGDRRRLAGAVDADDEDHLRPREGVDLEAASATGARIFSSSSATISRTAYSLRPRSNRSPASRTRILAGGRRAEIGGDQRLLDLVERLLVERGLGEQAGEIVAEPVGGLAEAGREPLEPGRSSLMRAFRPGVAFDTR